MGVSHVGVIGGWQLLSELIISLSSLSSDRRINTQQSKHQTNCKLLDTAIKFTEKMQVT